ncbi:PREDICTED: laminin subunit alpha-5-like [Thamnophis sirtalis]|uniref:Laminin subunit alpha-5-like n=1 Tax=Thamnophis sirtalis TaxID=35019 RepID=A0A6I9YVR5_9SAUR|nr:PREDICTED: laminin subunit alpha-5-like [Thamnophis sirtalis]
MAESRIIRHIIDGTNQDGFIQRAINASNAYASIIEAVKNAEEAASKAIHAADEALKNVLKHKLGDKAKEMKKDSNALEEAVKEEQRKLSGVKGALEAAKNKLAGTQTKKEQLLNQLNSAKNKLGMVHDDASEKIQKAKDAALKANETVATVEGKLSDMKKNVDEWKKQYGDLRSEDLNQATRDVKNTVSSLESTLPVLLGKLTSLENRRSHNATVLDNILRVRQLISLARNAVSKIKVPVKFNGTSGVQIRTPSNLQDLAAYTSLKFYIQNPDSKKRDQPENESTRFVLYLGQKDATGDYMGLILKDHKVEWIYKLGGNETTHLMVDEEIGEQFAAVSINRILQYGHMSVTVEKQTLHETKGDSVAKGEHGLFNFKPHNTIFYVGGYPSSFTPPPPLRYPNYRGCIEMDSLNEEVMSLYNFQRTFHLDTVAERPCTRSKSTGDPWLTDGSYFDGTGYAEITFESQLGSIKRFEQEMRLVSYHGIIFFLKHQNQLLCLTVRDGKLVLYYDFGGGLNTSPPKDGANLVVSNNANKAIQLFLIKMGTKDRVLVRLEQSTIFMIEQENILQGATSYYLGGVPTSVLPEKLKKLFPKGGSIRGCMKGLKALGKYVDLKRMNTIGVSYGCTLDLLVARSVKLHGSGYLTLSLRNVPPLQDFYTGFSFRTSQSRGLLYQHDTKDGSCQVSLQDGRVAVNVLSTKLTTKNAYADDTSHYVAIYSDSAGVRMYVDDQLQESTAGPNRERRQKREAELGVFHLGGLPSPSDIGNLTGCISNVFIKRRLEAQAVVDMQQSTESFNVTMNCPRDRQPQQMRAPEKKSRWKPKAPSKAMLKDKNCHLLKEPKAIKDAFQFGGSPASRLEFHKIPGILQERFHFSMELRLNSSSGLLFYMANESLGSSFSLFVSNGRLVLLADTHRHKLRLRTKEKYHDGRWHTVFFSRDGNRVQLVIDGLRSLEKSLPTNGVDFGISGPFYVGGAPLVKAKAHIPDASATSFKGCLRHLKLDKKPLNSPSRVFAVTPCYVGPLETGVFFSIEGGYITLDGSVAIGQDFEMTLEIRPRSSSGLIFQIGRKTHYLRLSSDSQKVTLAANTGTKEFSTSVSQPSLCDGQWHTITVIKGSNMIQLDVDTKANYTVGPNEVQDTSDKESIHLGGMPEVASLPHLRHPSSFVGCMKNLVINRNPIDIRQAGSTRGSVGLSGCPTG